MPLLEGTIQESMTPLPLAGWAERTAAPGTAAAWGVTETSLESDPSPTAFTALTRYKYVAPLVRLKSV